MCNIVVNPCGNTMQEWTFFFVLWSLHVGANFQMALFFAGWINCWEIHFAGDYAIC